MTELRPRGEPTRPNARRRLAARLAGPSAITLVLLALIASGAYAAPLSPVSSPSMAVAAPHSTTVSLPQPSGYVSGAAARSAAPRALSPTSSGPGTFFTTQTQPLPPLNNRTCSYPGECYNDTTEPSINLTSSGLLAVAYAAFTDKAPCPAMVNRSSTTEIGWSTSTNLGATWSAPVYLGNPVCTDTHYSSAAQPSLTSLANGTLVLTYEQYNWTYTYCTYCYVPVPPNLDSELSYDRIIVTESYDNGTTWTTPKVLDSVNTHSASASYPYTGFPDLRPSAVAIGQSIYIGWTNVSSSPTNCPASAEITVVHSTDGGSTWSNGTNLPVATGTGLYCSYATHFAAFPNLVISPSGELFIGYSTNYTSALVCSTYCNYGYTADVMVASSTDNGTTFNESLAASHLWYNPYVCCDGGVFYGLMPSLAYGAKYHQLFVVVSAEEFGAFCEYDGYYTYCSSNTTATNLYVTNSSDNGSSFAPAHTIGEYLVNPNGGPDNSLYNPSIAVDSAGVLHLQSAYFNTSVCASFATTFGNTTLCSIHQEIYETSTDNGTTFSLPVFVGPNWTVGEGYYEPELAWDGTYTSMVTAGDNVLLAWTSSECYNVTSYSCYWGGTGAVAQVQTSELFHGTGITLTFQETGLHSGVPWSTDVLGNFRAGTAPGTLSVSGVPPGAAVNYTVPNVQASWGVQYRDTLWPVPVAAFGANSTVYANYSEFVQVAVTTVPYFDTYAWSETNLGLSPAPSVSWVPLNTSFSESIFPQSPAYCYPCYNISFVSWTGSGPGNVSTLSQNISFTARGPVNETANFRYLGWCEDIYVYHYPYYNYSLQCFPVTYPVNFTESGLPAQTSWGVTWAEDGAPWTTNTTKTNDIEVNVTEGVISYYAWTVPSTNGTVWVPTTDSPSPITLPTGTVHLRYERENATSAEFPVLLEEQGLPTGTAWSIALGSASLGLRTNVSVTALPGGGPFAVTGAPVYLANGDGYYASSVSIKPFVENESSTSSKAPAQLYLNGSALITVTYSPMFLVTTTASAGGTVSPASEWLNAGQAVTLTETPNPGYHFVGWTGVGGGSTTAAQSNQSSPTITPTGPVTEFATFRIDPQWTWNLTVAATGIPSNVAFQVTLDGYAYGGNGTFRIGELLNGTYAVTVPYVYLNSSESTRYVATSLTSNLSLTGSGQLGVFGDGSLDVTFVTQYLVTLSATPANGGTLSVPAGAFWADQAGGITVTAAPSAGYYLVGWNGTGAGSVTQTAGTVTFSPVGPVSETAQFELRPIGPPATYWVDVTESGLPLGATWNVSYGGAGIAGFNATHRVVGLNGTYVLTVPDVYTSAGTRWVANVSIGTTMAVRHNATLAVTFSEEFEVSVTSSAGGAGNASLTWAPAGTVVTLSAASNATSEFVNWSGIGPGAYSGPLATAQVTVSGPVSEMALFQPIPPAAPKTSNSGLSGSALLGPIVAVVLIVVGLVVGLLMGRRPPRAEPEAPAEDAGGYTPEPGADASYEDSSWTPPGAEEASGP